jgi:hypothetical protein
MKIVSILLSLFITMSVHAETRIIPVQDLLFEIPSYTNAPKFNLGEALEGQWIPESPKRVDRKTQKQIEKKLIDIMWEEYPEAKLIRIWKGNLIVTL